MLRGCGAVCACSASGVWPVLLLQARLRVPVRCICCARMPGGFHGWAACAQASCACCAHSHMRPPWLVGMHVLVMLVASMDFSCLGGSCDHVVLNTHLELAHYPKAAHILRGRKLFACSNGVLIYLPPFTDYEVEQLYSRHYQASQRSLSFEHVRPVSQANFISRVLSLGHLWHVRQFNVVEVGCADGYLLARLARYQPSHQYPCLRSH